MLKCTQEENMMKGCLLTFTLFECSLIKALLYITYYTYGLSVRYNINY